MLSLVLLVLSAALARTTEAARDPRWMVDHWTVADGLPIEHYTGIARDPDGMLWLSSNDGLIRFDGQTFDVFRPSNLADLPSSRLVSMERDGDGCLWLVTEQGGVVRVRDTEVQRWDAEDMPSQPWGVLRRGEDTWILCMGHVFRVEDHVPVPFGDASQWGISDGTILRLVQAQDGTVWLATGDAVVHLDRAGALLARYTADPDQPRPTFTALALDAQGTPVLTSAAGLWRIDAGHIAPLPLTDEARGDDLCGLLPEPDGSLTVWGSGHLFRWSADGQTRVVGLSSPETCRDLLANPEQDPWRPLSGALVRDGQVVLQARYGVRAVLREGSNVWVITTGDGLYLVRPAAVQMVEGLTAGTGGVIAGGTGELVALLQRTLRRLDQGVQEVHIREVDGRPAVEPHWQDTAAVDALGRLWFGGAAGLCLLRGVDCLSIAFDHHNARPLVVDGKGALWIDTADGIGRTPPGQGPEAGWDRVEAHPPEQDARLAARLPDGSVVVAFEHLGLRHYGDRAPVETWTRADAMGLDLIRDLMVDAQGLLWIATVDGGLCRLDLRDPRPAQRPTPVCVGQEHGLPTSSIHSVSLDRQDRMWMSSNIGLFYVTRAEVDAALSGAPITFSPLLLTERDGLAHREANGTAWPTVGRASDGRLYFPTQSGVAVLDPAAFPWPAPPKVTLTAMSVTGVATRWDEPHTFTPEQRDVAFSWTAPEFHWPDQVLFRYRLRGYDDTWSALGTARDASWTNLPPGDYTLEVEAALGGVWSRSPAVVTFSRAPAFVETPWFLLSIGLGALALAGTLAWRRSWVRRARILELEQEVQRRTEVLADRNAALASRNALIAAQAARLAELDVLKSTFVSNLSHELRTPLTLVLGPLEELREAPQGLDGPRRASLDIAYRNAERLRELIQQLFDVARLDTGGLPLRARRQDLGALVRGVAERFSSAAAERGVRLQVHAADGTTAWVDPDLIDKVLTNLLSNALKFTPAGGHVQVDLCPPAHLDAPGQAATVTVTDTGPGIAPEQQARIFERFYQVDTPDRRQHGGAGIGLSLARELVELHGGALTLESTPGQGSAFRFTLPLGSDHLRPEELDLSARPDQAALTDPDLGEAGEPGEPDEDIGPLPTVLVVEDHADLRAYMAAHLAQRFVVRTAPDGGAALASARVQRPDLIVSDVMMPELDGISLCRALRADPALAQLPVILVSAKGAEADRRLGLQVAQAWFSKPFRMRDLVSTAARLAPGPTRAIRPPDDDEDDAPDATPRAPESLSEDDRQLLSRLLNHIQTHIADPDLSVALLARRMAYSRRQLLREVRRLTGQSVVAYIQQVRMETARALLRTRSAMTVAEVAEAVGMNRAYFSRLYSGWYGRAPSEDRVSPGERDAAASPSEPLSPLETLM